jgi:hypothetical protein
MDRNEPVSGADFEQLRDHVPITRRARPVVVPPPETSPESRLSVMDWLLAVGHVVARKLRGVPRAPMVRLYPKP